MAQGLVFMLYWENKAIYVQDRSQLLLHLIVKVVTLQKGV